MTAPDSQVLLVETVMEWAYRPRIRFAFSIGIFGGAVGAFAVIVNFLSQIELPYMPEHMDLAHSVVFAFSGGVGGLLVSAPLAFWLHGGRSVLQQDITRKPLGFIWWIALGLGFGLVYPLLMGAYGLPLTFSLVDFASGFMSASQVLSRSLDMLIVAPYFALVLGVKFFFTGLFAGAMFGAGAWVIDTFNSSEDDATAKYGSWAVAVSLAIGVILLLAIVPVDTLASLG